MERKHIALLLFFIFIQMPLLGGYELAHDEAYYWLYSKNLDWGFFDHPPMVGVIIKLFSFGQHSEFFIRIGFLLLQACGVVILWNLTSSLLLTTLLFISSPLASFSSLFALPDSPLLFMTIVYLWCLKRYFEKDDLKNAVFLGITIALLFYSKYHGAIIVGLTLLSQLKLLRKKSFYVVLITSLVLFFPHMVWEYQHDFATFRYHFLERPKADFGFKRGVEFILLQLIVTGLLAGPYVWYSILKKEKSSDWEKSLMWMALGSVLFFYLSTFSKKVEANWTVFLSPILICLVDSNEVLKRKGFKSLLYFSVTICLFARFILIFPGLGEKLKRVREFHGWDQFSRELKEKCDQKRILANTYQMASKLSFYLNENVHALNYQSRKNQFDFWSPDYPTETLCFVSDKKEFSEQSISSPDGKIFGVTKTYSYQELWKKKLNHDEAVSSKVIR